MREANDIYIYSAKSTNESRARYCPEPAHGALKNVLPTPARDLFALAKFLVGFRRIRQSRRYVRKKNIRARTHDAYLVRTGLTPVPFLPGRPDYWPLCPVSRRNPGRDASCPGFTASRHARIASAVLSTAIPSVRPSVRLSHAGIVSKRRHVARCSLHCQIAKCV